MQLPSRLRVHLQAVLAVPLPERDLAGVIRREQEWATAMLPEVPQ